MMQAITIHKCRRSCTGVAPFLLVTVALLLMNTFTAQAFQQRVPFWRWSTNNRSYSGVSMSSTDGKDDEIAKLEEQLRKLKEEKATETTATTTTDSDTAPDDGDEEILEEASMDMFLSEGWKEARSGYDPSSTATKIRKDEERGSLVGTVGTVVGGILALLLFSQIPVGQEDLSKYSSIKSGAPTTSIDLGDINRVKGQQSYGSDL